MNRDFIYARRHVVALGIALFVVACALAIHEARRAGLANDAPVARR